MTSPGRHPRWCRDCDPASNQPRHRSKAIRVGARRHINDRGAVTVLLTATGLGPTWLTLNAAHMVGVTVDLHIEDAVRLRDGLTDDKPGTTATNPTRGDTA